MVESSFPRIQATPYKPDPKDNEKIVRSLNRVMEGCVPLNHPKAALGRLYLAKRGLKRPMIDGLFFHPRLAYFDAEEHDHRLSRRHSGSRVFV